MNLQKNQFSCSPKFYWRKNKDHYIYNKDKISTPSIRKANSILDWFTAGSYNIGTNEIIFKYEDQNIKFNFLDNPCFLPDGNFYNQIPIALLEIGKNFKEDMNKL